MALIQDALLTKHLMRLSMAAGALLLASTALHGWRSATVPRPPDAAAEAIVLSPRAKDTKLVVDLGDRRVMVYRHGKELARYTVAVGQAGWETPIGEFKIHQMRRHPEWRHPITKVVIPAGPDNPLGDRWIGFYQGEHMALGFHGTPNESLVGQAVSHGCLRMRNRDIERMFEQVGTGSVVEVQP
jgi:L,D-transpeptidase ErfK/SrfK